MKTVSVTVQSDYLSKLSSHGKPVVALSEIIWNSLDADSNHIDVTYEYNSLGGIKGIVISDDGHGISYEQAVKAFSSLGGSTKKLAVRSAKERRFLHGKEGKGRLLAFSLGAQVTWKTVYLEKDTFYEFEISGSSAKLGTFQLTDKSVSKETETGTTVLIQEVNEKSVSLTNETSYQDLQKKFALYLRQYPTINVKINSVKLDPTQIQDYFSEYTLEIDRKNEAGLSYDFQLTIVEWKIKIDRSIYLCNAEGFALEETQAAIHAPGFNFTAYLKSEYFQKLYDVNDLLVGELNSDLTEIVNSVKSKLREHFRIRISQQTLNLINEWKNENIYPYENQPANAIEVAERQVFDISAYMITSYLPDFSSVDNKTKAFQFQLLRQAIENNPKALNKILEEVIGLSKEKQEELAQILDKTSLSSVISAAKIVSDRLNFLTGLESILFKPEIKKLLKERSQLHKILADNTWLFGEEYALTTSDKSLSEVLKKHRAILGDSRDREDLEPEVLREDGTRGIVDLMLSRMIVRNRPDEREHLVIELKRPSQKINHAVASQVESYAFAVASDERFKDTKTKWVFWAISNEITDEVKKKANQKGRSDGILYEDADGVYTIWVRTWGQIIDECRARLQFFQEKLNYQADDDSALDYLRTTYSKYLGELLENHQALPTTVSGAPDLPEEFGSAND